MRAVAGVVVVVVVVCCHGVFGGSLTEPDNEHPIVQTSAQVNNLKLQITQEQSTSRQLASQVTQLTNTITELRNRVDRINGIANNISKHVDAVVSATKPPTPPAPTGNYVVSGHQQAVAFEGIMRSDLENPHLDDSLIFNEAITDVGAAYNQRTGVFTCPVRGIYLFALTLMIDGTRAPAGTDIKVAIRKNGTTRPLAEPRTYSVAGIIGTGEVSVTEAAAGDQITVTYDSEYNAVLIKKYTRFTAVLIQELETVH